MNRPVLPKVAEETSQKTWLTDMLHKAQAGEQLTQAEEAALVEEVAKKAEADAKQAADDAARQKQDAAHKALEETLQNQLGRRRADAMLAGLRAILDSGRDPYKELDGDDANCIWGAASLYNRMAHKPDPGHQGPPPTRELSVMSRPAKNTLSKDVEAAAAAPIETGEVAVSTVSTGDAAKATIEHDFSEPYLSETHAPIDEEPH